MKSAAPQPEPRFHNRGIIPLHVAFVSPSVDASQTDAMGAPLNDPILNPAPHEHVLLPIRKVEDLGWLVRRGTWPRDLDLSVIVHPLLREVRDFLRIPAPTKILVRELRRRPRRLMTEERSQKIDDGRPLIEPEGAIQRLLGRFLVALRQFEEAKRIGVEQARQIPQLFSPTRQPATVPPIDRRAVGHLFSVYGAIALLPGELEVLKRTISRRDQFFQKLSSEAQHLWQDSLSRIQTSSNATCLLRNAI